MNPSLKTNVSMPSSTLVLAESAAHSSSRTGYPRTDRTLHAPEEVAAMKAVRLTLTASDRLSKKSLTQRSPGRTMSSCASAAPGFAGPTFILSKVSGRTKAT